MADRITLTNIRRSLSTIQRLTKNENLEIIQWNSRYAIYDGNTRVSDYYGTKRELWDYMRGYIQLRSCQK